LSRNGGSRTGGHHLPNGKACVVERDGGRIRLTERGMMVANDVAERFIADPEAG